MFVYPHINPVILHLGPLKIYWYGVMYLLGFLLAWCLGNWRIRRCGSCLNEEQFADLLFNAALGVVLGGRLGYMLFYAFSDFVQEPLLFFKIWQGGMSFHGGLLGVLLGVFIYTKRNNFFFFTVADFIAPLVPLGLAMGRIGNFINGELWGRVTDVPWAMIYPQLDKLPRHPSEIYEFLLEGILLFVALWWYSAKPRRPMLVSGWFLLGYGSIRFFVEFYRQPDPQLGFVAFNWLTMGQLLSVPMVLIGLIIIFYARRQNA